MSSKRIFIVLCISLLSVYQLAGKELSEEIVSAATVNWVRNITADSKKQCTIDRMQSIIHDGKTYAYIAHLSDCGFCICGANDYLLPVYLYSPDYSYSEHDPNLIAVIDEIIGRADAIEALMEKPVSPEYAAILNQRAEYWRSLADGHIPECGIAEALTSPDSMRINLDTYWKQDSIYRLFCPVLNSTQGDTSIVGCVATAISQIMYYWQWPTSGTGSATAGYKWRRAATWQTEQLTDNPSIPDRWDGILQWTPAGAGSLMINGDWDYSMYYMAWYIDTANAYEDALTSLYFDLPPDTTYYTVNFSTASYDMHLMQDDHDPPLDSGDSAVAKLCYHAGIAVNMNYGVEFSGAQSDSVESALQDHFKYDDDAAYIIRNSDTLVNEIQWLRPVYFRGRTSDDSGGHAWIVIGYNKTVGSNWQFLMNLGWGGGPAWYTCDNIPQGYNSSQKIAFWIAPEEGVDFIGAIDGGDGSPNAPYQHIDLANSASSDSSTWIFKAGSDNLIQGDSLVIDKPHVLKGYNATIR